MNTLESDSADHPGLARLYIVRHGETSWSLSGQHTARTDLPLTEHGELESWRLGRQLRSLVFSHVFTSPLLRARQTCRQIGWEATAEVDPDLVEWDYGDYEGKCSAGIRESHPYWNLFEDGCPGGETPARVCDRADRFIARARTLRGNVAVCSHGHFARVLGARWIGLSAKEAQRFILGTASLSILGYEHDRLDEPGILLWNATPHEDLNSTSRPPSGESRGGETARAGTMGKPRG